MGTPSNVDAGIITVTGGKVPVTLTPDAMSRYPIAADPMNNLFGVGEMITIRPPGATFQRSLPPSSRRSVVALKEQGIRAELPAG